MKFNPNILSDPLGGMATQFGIPTCILGLGADLLNLLPGGILTSLQAGIAGGMMKARSGIANVSKDLFGSLGIIEYDSQTGKLSFFSDTSRHGVDGFGTGMFDAIGNVMGMLAVAGQFAQSFGDQLDQITNCLGEFGDWLDGGVNKSNNR